MYLSSRPLCFKLTKKLCCHIITFDIDILLFYFRGGGGEYALLLVTIV